MTDADAEELRLIEAADGIASAGVDPAAMVQELEDWLSALAMALDEHRLPRPPCLRDTHALVREVDGIDDLLATRAADWTRTWGLLEPARRLARTFDDRVMLLVFGKFNAGKSSLCNLLAERFEAHGRAVGYFHVEAGRVVRTTQPLQEGVTETTARLQGVGLGRGLVLLDTPGLHSVTPENAALTQRFTDSADAVLWLTSSTSPGQVQELDEMARELHRCKPLLPVITRSDVLEEDEIDGAIVKVLGNKTPANRRLQEDDVHARARDKLARMDVPASVLKRPVSISAHAARAQGQTPRALGDGGFTRFYAAVLDLVEPARAYKQRKPVEVRLHHLEENVLGAIRSGIEPALHRLVERLSQERGRLQALKPRLARTVWRQVVPELPVLIDRHARAGGIEELWRELDAMLQDTLRRDATVAIGDWDFPPPGHGDLADVTAMAATWPTRPGSSAASVDFERLHDQLQVLAGRRITEQVAAILDPCADALGGIERAVAGLQDALEAHGRRFAAMKARLRGAPG